MKKSTKLSAFTLIELLIVIAVIGILAGMLFPAIKAVMNSAQGTRLANNGKQIVTAITSANIDREANSKGTIWPPLDVNFTDSNAYFSKIMKKGELTGISVSMFAGGGVPAAKDADDLANLGCVWSMLKGIEGCDDNMPFIWTRNMKITDKSKFASVSTDADGENWSDMLDSEETPFNDQQVVLARKGASFQIIKKKDLTDVVFLANSTNSAVEPVAAKGKEADTAGSDYWND